MLKITSIKITDIDSHNIEKPPTYVCDIVVKYYKENEEHHQNQIEVKSLKFSSAVLHMIAADLLREFKSKIAE